MEKLKQIHISKSIKGTKIPYKIVLLLLQEFDTPLVPDPLRRMVQAVLLFLLLWWFQDDTYSLIMQAILVLWIS